MKSLCEEGFEGIREVGFIEKKDWGWIWKTCHGVTGLGIIFYTFLWILSLFFNKHAYLYIFIITTLLVG